MHHRLTTLFVLFTAHAALAATGSISGRILNKDGVAIPNALVRVVADGATASVEGRNALTVSTRTDARGQFLLTGVPTGNMNLVVTWTAFDGSPQRGQPSLPIEVKANAETKLPEDLRLADAPVKLPDNSTSSAPAPASRGRRGGL